MYVIVVGGGKVGYYLTKELLEAGHELVILEKDATRARQIADEVGSIVLNRDGCEGRHLAEAGANRAAIVAAVTGDDEDNLVVCQMAKHHFDVPRTIARVNNPKNEALFRHLGVDELISPTRMALAAIEQDIPVHELLHLAQLRGGEEGGELQLIEAQIMADSPAVGRRPTDINLPEGCSLFVLIRGNTVVPLRTETVFAAGDKVLAISRAECEVALHRELIGDEAGLGQPPPIAAGAQGRKS
jgi:trk system potassium uptake protein TrkA